MAAADVATAEQRAAQDTVVSCRQQAVVVQQVGGVVAINQAAQSTEIT